jgi:hypothetical protein
MAEATSYDFALHDAARYLGLRAVQDIETKQELNEQYRRQVRPNTRGNARRLAANRRAISAAYEMLVQELFLKPRAIERVLWDADVMYGGRSDEFDFLLTALPDVIRGPLVEVIVRRLNRLRNREAEDRDATAARIDGVEAMYFPELKDMHRQLKRETRRLVVMKNDLVQMTNRWTVIRPAHTPGAGPRIIIKRPQSALVVKRWIHTRRRRGNMKMGLEDIAFGGIRPEDLRHLPNYESSAGQQLAEAVAARKAAAAAGNQQ